MFDACIDGGIDADPPTVFAEVWRKARKQHSCCECGQPIVVGQRYEHAAGLWDGHWETYRTCATCAQIRTSLFHGWMYGRLWEDIFDAYGGMGGATDEDWDTEDDDWLEPVSRFGHGGKNG